MTDCCQNYFIFILAMNQEAQHESEKFASHLGLIQHPVVCTMEALIRAVGWSLASSANVMKARSCFFMSANFSL